MTSPLSEHTVHVPPRQTCHVRATHLLKATQIALAPSEYNPRWVGKGNARIDARDALYLATDPEHQLSPEDNHITIDPTETVYVEIGNCGDETLVVTFEIRGEP